MEGISKRKQEEDELHRVLTSRSFSKSPTLSNLLQYICARYWEGSADELKEYQIAVEALHRPPDFDPVSDSAVRVEFHRLRKKLQDFYQSDKNPHDLVISLTAGSYAPRFIRSQESASSSAGEDSTNSTHTANEGDTGAAPDQVGISKVWHRDARMWIAGVSLMLLAFLAGWTLHRARPSATTTPADSTDRPAQTVVLNEASSRDAVRIIAGYAKDTYVDTDGHVWTADRYFHGGTSRSQYFRQPVTRTINPTLFESYRAGNFSYKIPLRPMLYEVRLYFMDTTSGPGMLLGGGEGSRLFNVQINGRIVLEDFDPYTDAGGNFIADIRAFKNVKPAPDGFLHIRFTSVKSQAFVNAIEIVPEIHGSVLPIRMVAQRDTYTDHEGHVWDPDTHYTGGTLAMNTVRVAGTRNPGLYAGERYGNFSYAIPEPAGTYTISLYFCESFFGPKNPVKGGVGSRVFNVICNGHELLRNFDIFKAAGGGDRAVVRTFRGIQPNAQGKIFLQFVPVENYACVNAIQVTGELR